MNRCENRRKSPHHSAGHRDDERAGPWVSAETFRIGLPLVMRRRAQAGARTRAQAQPSNWCAT